ncbi:hypothetical protein GGQ85_002384 [Nitrobacter vulgaris]|nr:hypothetical protein [Nitrobacter vulgaris]
MLRDLSGLEASDARHACGYRGLHLMDFFHCRKVLKGSRVRVPKAISIFLAAKAFVERCTSRFIKPLSQFNKLAQRWRSAVIGGNGCRY